MRLAVVIALGACWGLAACAQPRPGELATHAAPAADADRPPDTAGPDTPSPPPDPPMVQPGRDGNAPGFDAGPRDAPALDAAHDLFTGRGQLGEVCSAPDDCQSGFCQHGVCCASGCSGACRHCNLPDHGGTCVEAMGPSWANGCATDGDICVAPDRCLGPDQSCALFLPRDGPSGLPIAQTFVAGRSGRLVAVRLAVTCYGSQEFTLEIHTANNVDPEGPLLSTQTVRGPTPVQDTYGEGRLIPLPAPIQIRSGDQLSMVVRFAGPPYCSVGLGNGGCNFPGRFYRRSGDPPAWVIDNNADVGFRTYVVE